MTDEEREKLNQAYNFITGARKPFGAETPFGALGQTIGKAAKRVDSGQLAGSEHTHDDRYALIEHGNHDGSGGTHRHRVVLEAETEPA